MPSHFLLTSQELKLNVSSQHNKRARLHTHSRMHAQPPPPAEPSVIYPFSMPSGLRASRWDQVPAPRVLCVHQGLAPWAQGWAPEAQRESGVVPMPALCPDPFSYAPYLLLPAHSWEALWLWGQSFLKTFCCMREKEASSLILFPVLLSKCMGRKWLFK